jgi:hypothetical protein
MESRNRRWARRGTVPFNGDYIDIATRSYLPPDLKATPPRPNWTPNNGTVPAQPTVLFTWTDNRDMRDVAPGQLNPDGSVPFARPSIQGRCVRVGCRPKHCGPKPDATSCAQSDPCSRRAQLTRTCTPRAPSSDSPRVRRAATRPLERLLAASWCTYGTTAIPQDVPAADPHPTCGGTASFDQFASRTVIEPITVVKHRDRTHSVRPERHDDDAARS